MKVMLENYYERIIKPDVINKFTYSCVDDIPQLKKIILNFGCKDLDIKTIASSLLALELISLAKGSLTKSRRANVFLKIRNGNPTGCLVVLRNKKMYSFLYNVISVVLPNLKDFKEINPSKKLSATAFSFTLKDLICFKELEKHFYLFNRLPPLNITFIANTRTTNELIYLIKSFKFPIRFKEFAIIT